MTTIINGHFSTLRQSMTCLRFLIFVAVLSHGLSLYVGDHVYQVVDGTLEDTTNLNFTIMASHLNGFILFCIDSGGAQLSLKVDNKDGQHNLTVRVGSVTKLDSLNKLCGCYNCQDGTFHFDLSIDKDWVTVTCNNRSPLSVTLENSKDGSIYIGNNDNLDKKVPLKIHNKGRKTYVMIGNNGPWMSATNETAYPVKEILEACVLEVIYNGTRVNFTEHGTKVRFPCSLRCKNRICNDGTCIERSSKTPLCDCRLTPFNGPFCNRSLKMYYKEVNNTYEIASVKEMVYMKLSWKTLLLRNYCLMEIVLSHLDLKIWTNGSHLMVDSRVVSSINTERENFLSLNISNNLLVIKVGGGEFKYDGLVNDIKRINVGFMEANSLCETFYGAYDIFFPEHQFRPRRKQREPQIIANTQSNQSTQSTPMTINYPYKTWTRLVIEILIVVLMTCIVIITVKKALQLKFCRTAEAAGNIYEMEEIEVDKNHKEVSTGIDEGEDGYMVLP